MDIDKITNSIICGDCLDIMRDMPDNSVDLVVTSPPYNIGKNYKDTSDMQPWDEFMDWNEDILEQCLRLSDNVVWIIGSHNNLKYYRELSERLPHFSTQQFYHKLIYLPTWSIVNPIELAVYFYKDNSAWSKKHKMPIVCNGTIATYLPNIVGSATGDTLYGNHPCTFPERFPKAFIESLSDEGDLIFDPFSGTGTTSAVASKLKRCYIGIDISEEYCNIARKRLEAESKGITVKELKQGQGSLFGN